MGEKMKGSFNVKILLWILLLAVSYFAGVWGFAQIVGSLQTRQKNFFLPILVWLVILAAVYFAARKLLPSEMSALYIGYGMSLIQILCAGKIQ